MNQPNPIVRGATHGVCCALLLSCIATPHIASANSTVSTRAYTNSNPYGVLQDTDTDSNNVYYDGPGASQSTSSITNGGPVYSSVAPYPPVGSQFGEAFASSFAIEGVLRASVNARAGTAGLVQNAMAAQAFARASWNDGLTINATGLFGQTGFITAELDQSGNLGGGIGPNGEKDNAFVDVTARVLGTGLSALDVMAIDPILRTACGGWTYCNRLYSGHEGSFSYSNLPSTVQLSIPVLFGYQTSLSYTLDLYAYPGASTSVGGLGTAADGFADYSHTLNWGGITGVYDANGNPVLNFTATSTSGFDYLTSAVVPLPAAFWLLCSGLLSLFGVARRHA